MVSALRPALSNTKVYWANWLCARPGEGEQEPDKRGHFVIRLTDTEGFAMAKAYGILRVKLSRINPQNPRSSVYVPSAPEPILAPEDPKSLLSFPATYEIECELVYRKELALYDVYYTAHLPGRYTIYMANYASNHDVLNWVKVDRSTIYVRHFW